MTKKAILLILLCGTIYSAHSQQATINFTTVNPGGTYNPKHVLAVWAENTSNAFVKTLKVRASTRIKYLYSWNSKSNGNKVDAISGATMPSHQAHTLTWNCTDVNQNKLSDGKYKILIEFTDRHAQGPLDTIEFNISQTKQTLKPADKTYFKNVSLEYNPDLTVGINQIENKTDIQYLSTYPNPTNGNFCIDYESENIGRIVLHIYDTLGKELLVKDLGNTNSITNYTIDFSTFKAGEYFAQVKNGQNVITQKIIKY